MPDAPLIIVKGHQNIVAHNLHLHLLPAVTGKGTITRKRAWAAAAISSVGGASLTQINAHTELASCAVVAVLVTLVVVLRGAPRADRINQPNSE